MALFYYQIRSHPLTPPKILFYHIYSYLYIVKIFFDGGVSRYKFGPTVPRGAISDIGYRGREATMLLVGDAI